VARDTHAGHLTNELILASTFDSGRHLLTGTAPMRLLAEVAYLSLIAGSLPFLSGQGVADRRWRARTRLDAPVLPGRGTAPPADLTACAKCFRLARNCQDLWIGVSRGFLFTS
jgi:hypothetical protein